MTISKDDKLALSMGVLCFQGFGIRIFEGVMDGAIVLWLVVLIIMNRRYVRLVPHTYWLKVGFVVIAYFLFSLIKGVSVLPYLIVAWMSAAVVLTPYYLRQADFVHVMRRFTRFCMYYCLCHIPIMLFLKGALITTPFGMNPKTFSKGDYEGYMEQGMVNSFAALVVEWGIPITLLIFVLMFRTLLLRINN